MNIYVGICMDKLRQCRHWGCRLLLSPRDLKSLDSIEKIQQRMMCVGQIDLFKNYSDSIRLYTKKKAKKKTEETKTRKM